MAASQQPSSGRELAVVSLRDVQKVYHRDGAVSALDDISAELLEGSFTAVVGPGGGNRWTR